VQIQEGGKKTVEILQALSKTAYELHVASIEAVSSRK
jgi:hypothetical protein